MKAGFEIWRGARRCAGFTLTELMVAMVILTVLVSLVFSITNNVSKTLRFSSAKIEAFQDARSAFDVMTRAVSCATLNIYYDYYDAGRKRRGTADTATTTAAASFLPDVYGRYSDLEFVSGKSLVAAPRPQITQSIFFAAPLSFTQTSGTAGYAQALDLLNAVGFYIEFYNDSAERPSFIPGRARWRFRLMEMLQPTEKFAIYANEKSAGTGASTGHTWLTDPISASSAPVRLLAENVIACVVWPKLPTETGTTASLLSSNFEYDSNIANATPVVAWTSGTQPAMMNQLPPVVRLVLIATDEKDMSRLQGSSTAQPDLGFDYTKVFQSPAQLDDDLKTIGNALSSKHITYRVFQTDIALSGAKWTP